MALSSWRLADPPRFLAFLFGGGEDDTEDEVAPPPSTRKQWARWRHAIQGRRASRPPSPKRKAAGRRLLSEASQRSETLARAEANLPRGETVMTAGPEDRRPPLLRPELRPGLKLPQG